MKIFPYISPLLLLMVSCLHAVGEVEDCDLQQERELCLIDYSLTYRREQVDYSKPVVKCERISLQEARRLFPRVAAELTEREYIYVNISRLKGRSVGGSAYYLLDAKTGRILNRYHTR